MMTASRIACIRAAIVGLALIGWSGAGLAQNQKPAPLSMGKNPTPAALSMASEIINLKGSSTVYDRIFIGVIEKAKFAFMQSNPMLQKPLTEVAVQLRDEFRPRVEALKQDVARLYAQQFTELELKQALAFYKSPIGAKLLTVEPQVFERAMAQTGEWADKFADEVLAKMRNEMRKRGHEL